MNIHSYLHFVMPSRRSTNTEYRHTRQAAHLRQNDANSSPGKEITCNAKRLVISAPSFYEHYRVPKSLAVWQKAHQASVVAVSLASMGMCVAPAKECMLSLLDSGNLYLEVTDGVGQIRNAVDCLRDPYDPAQLYAALKTGADYLWVHELNRTKPDPSLQLAAYCGVIFRGDRLYAFNIGTNRILLCQASDVTRLSDDHGLHEDVEAKKRAATQTVAMKERGFSRMIECSDDPKACEQRLQVASIPLAEAADGLVVQVNALISEVLSDAAISAFVAERHALGKDMPSIAYQLYDAAKERRIAAGLNTTNEHFRGQVMVQRVPQAWSESTLVNGDTEPYTVPEMSRLEPLIKRDNAHGKKLLAADNFTAFLGGQDKMKALIAMHGEEKLQQKEKDFLRDREIALRRASHRP